VASGDENWALRNETFRTLSGLGSSSSKEVISCAAGFTWLELTTIVTFGEEDREQVHGQKF